MSRPNFFLHDFHGRTANTPFTHNHSVLVRKARYPFCIANSSIRSYSAFDCFARPIIDQEDFFGGGEVEEDARQEQVFKIWMSGFSLYIAFLIFADFLCCFGFWQGLEASAAFLLDDGCFFHLKA